MSYEQFITCVFRNYFERKFIIKSPWVLAMNWAFFIRNLQAHSFPNFLRVFWFLSLYEGVYSWLHSIIEQRIILGEIYYIQGVLLAWNKILDRKIKPLVATSWIFIHLHHQIILCIGYFECSKQITRLKLWIKFQVFAF